MGLLGTKYLRLRTPQTTDGVNTKINEQGMAVYKYTDVPLSAKKFYLAENEVLPPHLRHLIEEIDEDRIPIIPENKISQPTAKADPKAPPVPEDETDEEDVLTDIGEDEKEETKVVAPKKRVPKKK